METTPLLESFRPQQPPRYLKASADALGAAATGQHNVTVYRPRVPVGDFIEKTHNDDRTVTYTFHDGQYDGARIHVTPALGEHPVTVERKFDGFKRFTSLRKLLLAPTVMKFEANNDLKISPDLKRHFNGEFDTHADDVRK